MGEACEDTCTKYHRDFSYVVADMNDPVTPHLVGHIPKQKQEPWTALECYVPSEDRYHTANANSAKHFVDESGNADNHVGTFTNENCKLACPCSLTLKVEDPETTVAPVIPDIVPEVETTVAPVFPASGGSPVVPASGGRPSAPEASPFEGAWMNPDLGTIIIAVDGAKAFGEINGTTCEGTVDGNTIFWAQDLWGTISTLKEDGRVYTTVLAGSGAHLPDSIWTRASMQPDKEGCEWIPAYSCLKEFDYEGKHFSGCTTTDHDTPWCSNTDPYRGSWNKCVYSCANPNEDEPENEPVLPSREGDKLCHWEMNANCSETFFYKGKDYDGCITVDYPSPWCSHDRIHKGLWSTCDRVCTEASGEEYPPTVGGVIPPNDTDCTGGQVWNTCGSACEKTCEEPAPKCTMQCVSRCECPADKPLWNNGSCIAEENCTSATTTATPTTVPSEDPCARHPETENDEVGATVTLDEEGYKVAAATEAPINMKRFVCRVVDQIGCRVNDYAALKAFVPYYSGLEGEQSYKVLKFELKMLCDAGGHWVEPKTKSS
jgi:hypothetical protein